MCDETDTRKKNKERGTERNHEGETKAKIIETSGESKVMRQADKNTSTQTMNK